VPLSPPLVGAATVMVPPEVAPMVVAPCPDPPGCPDMVGGMRVSVFGPEEATITGALCATGGAGALVDATGSVDAIGAMLTGIAMP